MAVEDSLMDFFNQEDRLMINDGGQKVELFPVDVVYEDFTNIMDRIFLKDDIGQNMYTNLVDSGKIKTIQNLWEMAGKPKLTYDEKMSGKLERIGHPAAYTRDIDPNKPSSEKWGGSGSIYIGDPEAPSTANFDHFIAELAHSIGYNNPAMMKLGVEEITNEVGKVIGVSKSAPTYNFLQELDSFPTPESPGDSLAVWKDWWKSQPESIRKPKGSEYTEEGHYENITHLRIEGALRGLLHTSDIIPLDWGANDPASQTYYKKLKESYEH